jgi:hypothetical protein
MATIYEEVSVGSNKEGTPLQIVFEVELASVPSVPLWLPYSSDHETR